MEAESSGEGPGVSSPGSVAGSEPSQMDVSTISPQQQQPQEDEISAPSIDHEHEPSPAPPLEILRPDSATRLNVLEAILRKPDAVMEPAIMNSLREYVVAGGHPQHAVELLTEHYVGYAEMASLACGWLKLLDIQDSNEQAYPNFPPPPQKNSSPSLGGLPSPQIGGATRHLSPDSEGPTRQSSEPLPLSAMDESYFLRKLVLERFDPHKFSGIFSAGGSGAPEWLNSLVSDREGRGLIYDLSSRYQTSLLLNFAMQKIVMQPGRDAEAAAVGVSLVGYFGVYHRLLGVRLRQAAAAKDEATLQQISKQLCEGAAQSQHAYVHAQQMLRELARDPSQPWAPRFIRIAQELEASVQGPVPWKMHRWFEPEAAIPANSSDDDLSKEKVAIDDDEQMQQAEPEGQQEKIHKDKETLNSSTTLAGTNSEVGSIAAWLVADILASTSSGSPAATSDVIKLYRLYCPQSVPPPSSTGGTFIKKEITPPPGSIETTAPPTSLLRHPRLIEALLHVVFSPGKQLLIEAQMAFVSLLALAVAAVDDYVEKIDEEGENKEKTSSSFFGISPLNQPAVVSVRESLITAAELAHKAFRDEILSEDERQRGEDAIKEPCCAAGILSMLRSRLNSHEYWETAYHIHKEPPFLPLLISIVKYQPQLHIEILPFISSALSAMGNSPAGPDVAQALFKAAVELVVAGRVEYVLEWAEKWARNAADAALVRHLFFGLLEIAAPPYSPRFAGSMVRLGALGGALRQKMGSREWTTRVALLSEFAAACAAPGAVFEPLLGRDETSFLRELHLCLKNSGHHR